MLSLAAGATKKVKLLIEIPVGVPAADYFLFLVVDRLNGVGESDELNNILRTPVPISVTSGP